jgi:hypothetical protein
MGTTMPESRRDLVTAMAYQCQALQETLDYLSNVVNYYNSVPTMELSEVVDRAEQMASNIRRELWNIARDAHHVALGEIGLFYEALIANIYPPHPIDISWKINDFFLVLGGIASYIQEKYNLEYAAFNECIRYGGSELGIREPWILVSQYVQDYVLTIIGSQFS